MTEPVPVDPVVRPVPYPSISSESFWTSGADGRLRIARCEACSQYHHPPQPICPQCHSVAVTMTPVSGRITGAAVCVGVARHAVTRGADYARTRSVWGPAIGSYQAISHPLAKAKIEVDLAAMMTAKAAWLYDKGHPAGEASNVAKYAAAEAAVGAVDHAIQIHGGNGLSAEYGLVPQWGLARLLQSHQPAGR